MNESEYIYCTRCGAPMKREARYCMKCGNLNYDHPDNQKMKEFAPKQEKTYEIGSGKITANTSFTANSMEHATNTGNKQVFLTVNVLWFLLTYGLSVVLGILHIINFSAVFFIFLILSLFNIYIIPLEIINMKANKPWWGALVPIYNIALLTEIAFGKMIYFLFYFIPVVNMFFLLVAFYQLGKRFNKNPILTMLFNIFMLPIIAFGTSLYNGINYVDLKDKDAVEKEFKMRRGLLYCILLFFIVGLGGFIYCNITSVDTLLDGASDEIFVQNAKIIVNKVKKNISKGNFTCSEETSLTPNSIHYFVFDNVEDEFGIPSFSDRSLSAYVKVFNNSGTLEYFISITDGERGFSEIKDDTLDSTKLGAFKELPSVDKSKECFLE